MVTGLLCTRPGELKSLSSRPAPPQAESPRELFPPGTALLDTFGDISRFPTKGGALCLKAQLDFRDKTSESGIKKRCRRDVRPKFSSGWDLDLNST